MGTHRRAKYTTKNIYCQDDESNKNIFLCRPRRYLAAQVQPALARWRRTPRLVNTQPLIMENKSWIGLKLAEDHPASSIFRRCEVRERMIDFTEQKRLLEELYQKWGKDVFADSYFVSEKTVSGKIQLHRVWGQGIVSDQPRPVCILLTENENKILGWCSWEGAVAAFPFWLRWGAFPRAGLRRSARSRPGLAAFPPTRPLSR